MGANMQSDNEEIFGQWLVVFDLFREHFISERIERDNIVLSPKTK